MRARSRSNGRASLKGPGRSTSYGFSMGSEPRLTEAAASLAAALRRRRLPGTHCLQVTMCHGGGSRPRMPELAYSQPQRARPSTADAK